MVGSEGGKGEEFGLCAGAESLYVRMEMGGDNLIDFCRRIVIFMYFVHGVLPLIQDSVY